MRAAMKFLCSILVLCLFVIYTFAEKPAAEPLPSQANEPQIAVALERIQSSLTPGAIDSPGQVVVVYFTAQDRKPAANHVERIRRIVEETAGFYERELKRNGFPNRHMNVLRNAQGQVEVIDVVGAEPDANYGKPAGSKIRTEAQAILREKKIDADASVLLIFCNMMDYDAKASTISHHSPYYGGGSYLQGTAWQCDSEILDPLRFKDPTPITDGEYGRITIGRHNSIFIGGVIHELGHALSLPHCRERSDEKDHGTALMGSGNRTYAQEQRGEGLGTFLTQAHALRLAAHPVFNQKVAGTLFDRPTVQWPQLRVDVTEKNEISVRGSVQGSIPIHALVAYFDPAGGGDYNSTTATAVPDGAGNFSFASGSLSANKAGQLRLFTCHVNGATTSREFSYKTDSRGKPDLSSIRLALELQPMVAAIRTRDLQSAKAELERIAAKDEALHAIGQRVLDRFQADWNPSLKPAELSPDSVPEEVKSISLSQVCPLVAKVGWLRPAYDQVPNSELLLSVDGDYFAQGIYAHAPAQHQFQLNGGWLRLKGRCGLQSGNFGKVDFEILGDEKSLWKAQGIEDGAGANFDLDLTGIKVLTLLVTDGGNGTNGDWGVWIEPQLSR